MKNRIFVISLFFILFACKKDNIQTNSFPCSGCEECCERFIVTGSVPEITYLSQDSASFNSFYDIKKQYPSDSYQSSTGHRIPDGLITTYSDDVITGWVTVEDLYTDGIASDDFIISTASNLSPNTEYTVQTYINIEWQSHTLRYLSESISFKTLALLIEIETGNIDNITSSSALVYGKISEIGTFEVTQHGHVWSVSQDDLVIENESIYITELGSIQSDSTYFSNVSNLNPNTIYFVKAYLTHSNNLSDTTIYGNIEIFTTSN